MNNPIIAITGGIGSGKSVISKLLRVMGYTVYDCDERARWVMTHDVLLRQQLIDLFGSQTYLPTASNDMSSTNPKAEDWVLNKPYLSAQIFRHPGALAQMNACVHPAVARDLMNQYKKMVLAETDCKALHKDHENKPFFFESAIIFESGFDQLVPPTSVWMVSAPLELRIERAMKRDQTSRERVQERIDAQMSQEEKERRSEHIIYNDLEHSLIAQVNHLLLCLQKKNANKS